jgi:hypothetical protein
MYNICMQQTKGHKQIQVEFSEWERYKRLADELSQELDIKVPINALVKKAVSFYENGRTKSV